MPEIFISYRREDSPHFVRLLYSELKRKFGEDAIFFDISEKQLGLDYVDRIGRVIANCSVLLVVIGPSWLDILTRRQNAEVDRVRFEIETALNHGKWVMPLNIDGAKIPSEAELPSAISKLAVHDGMQIRAGHDFDADIARLTDGLVDRGIKRKGSGPKSGSGTGNGPGPGPEVDPVKKAKLDHIASIVAPLVENDDALEPSNYNEPVRALVSDEIRNQTGITEKSDDSVTLGEPGSELFMWELVAAFEKAFDKSLEISLDSSVMSIYADIFDD